MRHVLLTIILGCLFAMAADAQTPAPTPDPTTPGMVSRVTYMDVLPGKTNELTTFLRTYTMPILEEQKKQGLIASYGFFTKPTTEGPGDWDLGLVVTYKNYADAIDFSAERNAKFDFIALARFGSADARTKANDLLNTLRTVTQSMLVRGITFNPMPK
ncbi:MAG: hypothetical protein KF736_06075 [Acidobacteria bacterium]|nr:hypothetical protein [Acidobacteriota bacterium]MCW5948713.1 hypothetical protein [Pyrinomonadaceae bacterium]